MGTHATARLLLQGFFCRAWWLCRAQGSGSLLLVSPVALPLPSVRGRFHNPDPVTEHGARGAAPKAEELRDGPVPPHGSSWCSADSQCQDSHPLPGAGASPCSILVLGLFFPSVFEQCSQLCVGFSLKTPIPVGFPPEVIELGPQEPPRGRRQQRWGQLSCTRLCPAGCPCPAIALLAGQG